MVRVVVNLGYELIALEPIRQHLVDKDQVQRRVYLRRVSYYYGPTKVRNSTQGNKLFEVLLVDNIDKGYSIDIWFNLSIFLLRVIRVKVIYNDIYQAYTLISVRLIKVLYELGNSY